MKQIYIIFLLTIFILGCSKEPSVMFEDLPQTNLQESDFKDLPNWKNENYDEVLASFVNNCRAQKSVNLYDKLCITAQTATDAKEFLENNFSPYFIVPDETQEETIMTGYFEPELHGSLTQTQRFKYPIYETPKDLLVIALDSVYPDLKQYRLRGRLDEKRVVAYYSREEINKLDINAEVICYCDSKIDRFFLEVQGSGRVKLDNGDLLYIGYDNQNGHSYNSIGKYLVKNGELTQKEVSLQTIRAWFKANTNRVDEVLNHNTSFVFFKQRQNPASGSLGLVLTPLRSIAVDRRYIPLGSMLYLSALGEKKDYKRIVFAQDTGGAIKGALRADMFLGFGDEAGEIAGELKAPLKLWILLPKTKVKNKI